MRAELLHIYSIYIEFVTLIEIEIERKCVCAEFLHINTANFR